MKHLAAKILLILFIGFAPAVSFSQEEGVLECRLVLAPLSFECLNSDQIAKDAKSRENVFVPESQVQVIKNLEKKEQNIQKISEEQQNRQLELRQIEERIEQKLTDLRLEREKFESLRQEKIKIDQDNLNKLVAYYEKMDPENAAGFVNAMDVNTASHLIMSMNPRKGSKIMELLNVPLSVQITETVAGFKKNLEEAENLEDPNRLIPQNVN